MELVEPILADHGLELVDAEWRREAHGQVVRLFVDREGGIDLEALSALSRELSDHLDAIDFIEGAYTLEVSSPGINRPLRKPEHFRGYVGQKVRVRTVEPIRGQRNFLGRLRHVTPESIVLEGPDGAEIAVSFSDIERANYEHEFSAADFGGRREPRRLSGPRSGRR
jgi:ribosome maturation factor RimP